MSPKFAKIHTIEIDESIEEQDNLSQEIKEMILSLPIERGWRTPYLYLFQGFWCQPAEIQAISTFQNHFQAKKSDVFVATKIRHNLVKSSYFCHHESPTTFHIIQKPSFA
ncbi:cytosolic sulfotransferase [Trifolium repens]|nr:cytosolic sulfotransferase [Trifolium repens]